MSTFDTVVRTRFLMFACLSALAIGMAVPAAVAAAKPPIAFGVHIGDSLITVSNPSAASTTVRLRDRDGKLKATDVLDGTDDYFELPNGVTVEIGDRIRADDGSYARKFVVPELSIIVDRVTDMFHGTGPAQRTIRLGWGGRFGDTFESRGIRVRPDGTWSFHAPFDVPGGQRISVNWRTPNGDTVGTRGSAAVLLVTLGSARFLGNAAEPLTNVEVLLEGAHVGAWTGQSAESGEFRGRLRRPNGNLVRVVPGDRISAPSLAVNLDWIVPDVQISADAATDFVTGQCAGTLGVIELFRDGSHVARVLVNPGDLDEFEFDWSDPMASDYVTGLFADEANVRHGDSLRIECILGTGDSVLLRTVVP